MDLSFNMDVSIDLKASLALLYHQAADDLAALQALILTPPT